MSARKRARERGPTPELRCVCGHRLQKYWNHCPNCARELQWRDLDNLTGAECFNCGWIVSDRFSWCPWCAADIYEEGYSSETPLKAPKGFRMDARCDWGCGGGVQYPMRNCPWCGRAQHWDENDLFEGDCPHCERGVDDWMNACPWCGNDATGRDLIPRALTRVRRLLLVSRIRDWGYRVLLRPGISGVDPRYPKIVEIEQRYVVGKRRQDEMSGSVDGGRQAGVAGAGGVHPPRREETGLEGDDEDNHLGDPERGKGICDERRRVRRPVHCAAGATGRQKAERDAGGGRQRQRRAGQQDGGRQPEGDHLGDGPALGERGPQVPAQHPAGVGQVLLRQGPVETQVGPRRVDLTLVRPLAGELQRRITGTQVDEQERQRDNPEDGWDDLEQAPDEVAAGHRSEHRSPGASLPRRYGAHSAYLVQLADSAKSPV